MTPFKDHSQFQGITQYYDSHGTEWRRTSGVLTFNFYELVKTNLVDDFALRGSLLRRKVKGRSIEQIHSQFLEGTQ